MAKVGGYAYEQSVAAGDELVLHLGTYGAGQTPPPSDVDIEVRTRFGPAAVVATASATAPGQVDPRGRTPDEHAAGFGWAETVRIAIPRTARSTVYDVVLTPRSSGVEAGDLQIVVRRPAEERSSVAVVVASATGLAYSYWDGIGCLYPTYPFPFDGRSHTVSPHRPGIGLVQDSWGVLPWMSEHLDGSVDFDCIISQDLHNDPEILHGRALVVISGHDEYWSAAMRDNVEGFVARGGNLACFSGNTCWWQVRFEGSSMVCYKDPLLDPILWQDPAATTGLWREWPVYRPENHMIGLSFAHGGWKAGGTDKAFTCLRPDSWVFEGVGVARGDTFGEGVIAYEVDGLDADYDPSTGTVSLSYADGVPPSVDVLAIATVEDWVARHEATWNSGFSGGFHGISGTAAMVLCHVRTGTIFNSGTTRWGPFLDADPQGALATITGNVLQRLSRPRPSVVVPRRWNPPSEFERRRRRLEAFLQQNRQPAPTAPLEWERIGRANQVTAMTAAGGYLWAASAGRLWRRDPWGFDVDWADVDQADDLHAMATDGVDLWAADGAGRLLCRPATSDLNLGWQRAPFDLHPAGWTLAWVGPVLWTSALGMPDLYQWNGATWTGPTGQSNSASVLCGYGDQLLGVYGDRVGIQQPGATGGFEGFAGGTGITALAYGFDKLFATTADGHLLRRGLPT